ARLTPQRWPSQRRFPQPAPPLHRDGWKPADTSREVLIQRDLRGEHGSTGPSTRANDHFRPSHSSSCRPPAATTAQAGGVTARPAAAAATDFVRAGTRLVSG